jgi:hypothetical protein
VKLIDRDAPNDSPEKLAWYIACSLDAYAEPVPPGKMGRAERDSVARMLGARWAAKVARGEASCAWHEIASWRGTACWCQACRPDVRRFA